MRRLKPEEVGLVSIPGTQRVTSEPNVQTTTTQPRDTTVAAEQPAQSISDRIGVKQQSAALEEYRQTFLRVPRIENRKPVFVSCEVRDRLDEIVRRLGGRRMSVSGLIETLPGIIWKPTATTSNGGENCSLTILLRDNTVCTLGIASIANSEEIHFNDRRASSLRFC